MPNTNIDSEDECLTKLGCTVFTVNAYLNTLYRLDKDTCVDEALDVLHIYGSNSFQKISLQLQEHLQTMNNSGKLHSLKDIAGFLKTVERMTMEKVNPATVEKEYQKVSSDRGYKRTKG